MELFEYLGYAAERKCRPPPDKAYEAMLVRAFPSPPGIKGMMYFLISKFPNLYHARKYVYLAKEFKFSA